MDWNNVLQSVLTLILGGGLVKILEEWRKGKLEKSADKRTDRSVDFEQERQRNTDAATFFRSVIDELKIQVTSANAKVDRQDAEIGRLRDSELTCRAENATLNGRLFVIEKLDREKALRIRRLEKRLVKLTGDPGSWEEEPRHQDGSSKVTEAGNIEVEGEKGEADTSG